MIESSNNRWSVAVFDLDATLTRFDTLLPFVVGYLRHVRKRRVLALLRLLPCLFCVWRWRDLTWWKHQTLAVLLGGEPRTRIEAWAETFAQRVVANGLRAEGLATLRRHQAAGARVVLASASVDIYVEPIARALGIHEVLATRSCWDAHGRLHGLAGANCRDAEKLERVRVLSGMPADGSGVIAYSDSHADLPLLGWAERGVAVCPSRRLLRRVAGLELEIARW
ncbi:HAD-IB family hydrolase [Salinisphaera sp. USBA-960]|uniref:HAD family hydrolase n=1 Tax=Salinisphaera orenii TaxID=856731 RepID=UPI0013A6447E|nr:HAD-IB family hydrolase [Salifodinibacter halophilus]NNC25341.1 HAD-IB family hydrolase [Salifodinibacter halophilus]